MTDNIVHINDHINKKDLEIILEVNRKAIAIESCVADQNEEIISLLNITKDKQESSQKQIEKLLDKADATSKDIFKLQVLFVSGLLSLVIQIIQIFLKK
jgi:hypothetical protein